MSEALHRSAALISHHFISRHYRAMNEALCSWRVCIGRTARLAAAAAAAAAASRGGGGGGTAAVCGWRASP